MTQQDISALHARFGHSVQPVSPSAASAPASHPVSASVLTFTQPALAAQAVKYNPGWLEAVLAAAAPIPASNPPACRLASTTLDAISRRFAPGCCGH